MTFFMLDSEIFQDGLNREIKSTLKENERAQIISHQNLGFLFCAPLRIIYIIKIRIRTFLKKFSYEYLCSKIEGPYNNKDRTHLIFEKLLQGVLIKFMHLFLWLRSKECNSYFSLYSQTISLITYRHFFTITAIDLRHLINFLNKKCFEYVTTQ